jgi:hypothetical protein
VYVKYFKKATDTSATATKTIAVKVVDVNPAATKAALEVVAGGEIDAYADYTLSNPYDVDSIDFASEVYVLDANGNRLQAATGTTVALVGTDSWVSVTGTSLGFTDPAEARTFLTESGTAKVNVEAAGITKQLSITYKNSAKVPASVTVATSPVTVKLPSTVNTLTIEELIFGVIDPDQLVKDADINEYIAVKSAATNGGYKYNKPLVTVKDASGAVLPIGANVYGLNASATDGNIWADEELATAVFSRVNCAVDFSVANVEVVDKDTTPDSSLTGDTVTVADSGDTVRFTLVIDAIYVAGGNADDNNLLAGPVAVNVTVTK